VVDPRPPSQTPVPFEEASFPAEAPFQPEAFQQSGAFHQHASQRPHYSYYDQPHHHEQSVQLQEPAFREAFPPAESFPHHPDSGLLQDRLSQDLASLSLDRDAGKRPSGRVKWIAILGALGGAAVAIYVLVVPYITSRAFKTRVAVTEISLVSSAQAQVLLTSTGYVVPLAASSIGAKVSGRVTAVQVKPGDVVKAGRRPARARPLRGGVGCECSAGPRRGR
jgi:hypothetical protein